MARVNVETRALAESRFFNLVQDLEMSRAEAIGTLVIFWHDSQERRVWKGTKEEVMRFIPFRSDIDSIFLALLANDYVSASEDGQFVIRGNKKHIDALDERKTAAQSGGKRSGEVRREKHRKINPNEALASAIEAPASPCEPKAIQSNTKQSNTKQSKAEGEGCAPALPSLARIWNESRGSLPEVKGCSGTRRKNADARWRGNPSEDYWSDIVRRIARSAFCCGDNDRGWRAGFDFLIRPETQHKVLEGKYDRTSANHSQFVDPEIEKIREAAARESEDWAS